MSMEANDGGAIDPRHETVGNGRSARMNRDKDGNALGIAIVINADELEQLGVDVDTDEVPYRVVGGDLRVGDRR